MDWPGYKAQAEAAARPSADGDLLAAFRHHCRALALLAAPFNQHRPKEEVFRPKWELSGCTQAQRAGRNLSVFGVQSFGFLDHSPKTTR